MQRHFGGSAADPAEVGAIASYAIRLLGPPVMEGPDGPIRVSARKATALLWYIAARPDRAYSRQHLAALLWPDDDESLNRNRLNTTLTRLHQALPIRPFKLENDLVVWHPESEVSLDIQHFCELTAGGARTSPGEQMERVRQAITLWRGQFLHGMEPVSPAFEDWLEEERRRWDGIMLETLERLVQAEEATGDWEGVMRHAQLALTIDPFRERFQRCLMLAAAQSGNKGAALAHYAAFRKLMQSELGVDPDPDTVRLRDEIASGEMPRLIQAIPPGNLPSPLDRFVGREAEAQELGRLLHEKRLVTVMGPGGVGKTRLALQVARRAAAGFADGAFLVQLARVVSPDMLASAIEAELPLPHEEQKPPKRRLVEFLRAKNLLLLLDNFEHLVAGAGLLIELLESSPGLKILVTSRERLRLPGEWLVELSGLPVSRAAAAVARPSCPAAELFAERARTARPGFVLTGAEYDTVTLICQMVDGFPLGIELAAAWTRVLSCREILDGMQQGPRFLTTSQVGLPERHRSLHAAFAHSWNLMTPEERRALGALSVFRGGCDREAAAALADASPALLLALIDKSLVRHLENGRFEMHEVLRQMALGSLDDSSVMDARRRHAAYFAAIASQINRERLEFANPTRWMAILEAEHANLEAALDSCEEEPESAVQLAAVLGRFWYLRRSFQEAKPRLSAVLRQPGADRPTYSRGFTLLQLGNILLDEGDVTGARAVFEELLEIGRAHGEPGLTGFGLITVAMAAIYAGECSYAEALTAEAAALALQDNRPPVYERLIQGAAIFAQGEFDRAEPLLSQIIEVSRKIQMPFTLVAGLAIRAMSATLCGELGQARRDLDEARPWVAQSGTFAFYAWLADGLYDQTAGEVPQSAEVYRTALTQQRDDGVADFKTLPVTVELVAGLLAEQGEPATAARLLGAMEDERSARSLGRWTAFQPHYAAALEAARSALGETVFQQEWEAGQHLGVDKIILLAIEALGRILTPAPLRGQRSDSGPAPG